MRHQKKKYTEISISLGTWLPFQCNAMFKTFMVFNYRNNTHGSYSIVYGLLYFTYGISLRLYTDPPHLSLLVATVLRNALCTCVN